MRFRDSPGTPAEPRRADNIAYDYNLYQVDDPCADLPADYAENIWKQYESKLPDAAEALEGASWNRDDWLVVLQHIQAVWIRQPGSDKDIRAHLASHGIPNPSNDKIEDIRRLIHEQMRGYLHTARFAIVRRHAAARRFIINNRGYVPMADSFDEHSGVLFPLTGNVAVLMARGAAQPGDDIEAGPIAELVLNAGGARSFHAATWNHVDIEFVAGHPDDAGWIDTIPESAVPLPSLGPYRGNRHTTFRWAGRNVAT